MSTLDWSAVVLQTFFALFLSILLYLQNKVIATNITNTPPGFQVYLMNGPYEELFSIFFKELGILVNMVLKKDLRGWSL